MKLTELVSMSSLSFILSLYIYIYSVEVNLSPYALGSSSTFQKLKHKKQSQVTREKSSKRSSKKSTVTESTSSSSSIGGKDTSLFLFRVLGKVLYCKRK